MKDYFIRYSVGHEEPITSYVIIKAANGYNAINQLKETINQFGETIKEDEELDILAMNII